MKIYLVKRRDGQTVGVYSSGLRDAAVKHVALINGELEERNVTLIEAVRLMASASDENGAIE